MHIDDNHRHYGSALIQIAEDPHFTAINAFRYLGRNSRCAFRVNKDIGVYVRYRTEPQGARVKVYTFAFGQDNLTELRRMSKRFSKLFLALVCVADREICCIPYVAFEKLVNARRVAKGEPEAEYIIEVNARPRKRLRVWVNPPNRKGLYLQQIIIRRNDFPRALFGTPRKQ
jgi:hypothetical protein